ncbi:MAG TPA: hypothetical protein VMY35_13420 [Phycisphaerae bacterium]|nr:hypothetical protein [Phycisphaerae bacterium]
MPDATRTKISDALSEPVDATADGIRARQPGVLDKIAADRHLSAAAGAAKGHRGVRYTKLIPPDATGSHPS